MNKTNQEYISVPQQEAMGKDERDLWSISASGGIFHLVYDGTWRVLFASEGCLAILRCDQASLLERLRTFMLIETEQTVGELLKELAAGGCGTSRRFACTAQENGMDHIGGSLEVSVGEMPQIYGQLSDLRKVGVRERERKEELQNRAEEQAQLYQQVFRIVSQHSNKTLYSFDLDTGVTTPWDEEYAKQDVLDHIYTGNFSTENPEELLRNNPALFSESIDPFVGFFKDIYAGKPFGEVSARVKLKDGTPRWYQFQYSSFFDGERPKMALITSEDVTEQHEREVAYGRYVQFLESEAGRNLLYIDANLTENAVYHLDGWLMTEEDKQRMGSYSELRRQVLEYKYHYVQDEEAANFFSLENLLRMYERGERRLRREWPVTFADGSAHWIDTDCTMMPDPYNGEVKVFIQVMDITKEKENQMSTLLRADCDDMTGLLRRGAGEEQIKKFLMERRQPGGVLLLIDLDDLKGINDYLGHAQGDRALTSLADTLKSHFRKDDVLVRIGGDEFMAFLPGAGQSISSVELSLSALLRKFSIVCIGQNDERAIHCSIGCAVELSGTDTFESLFQRADMALYHVKRGGKNNFAFFDPAMLEADYRFKERQAQPVMNQVAQEELRYVLEMVAVEYPGVVLLNLTQNYFHVLSIGNNVGVFPVSEQVDAFWEGYQDKIHPSDRKHVLESVSRESLLALYAQGKREISYNYRNLEKEGYISTELIIRFFASDDGDICTFLLFHWAVATEKDREIQRLQKILGLFYTEDFAYICLIDILRGTYSTFRRDGKNAHNIPENADFEMVTHHIRDTQIPEQDRENYYSNAALKNVLNQMRENAGSYSYRYTTMDGDEWEALFSWYEDTHTELLMVVRKLS